MTLFVSTGFTSAQYPRKVSDSLVKNLSCENLNADRIYEAIRPNAFDTSKHFPFRNFAFRSVFWDLGACWSFSHAQRILFYLGRFNDQTKIDSEAQTLRVLDYIRKPAESYLFSQGDFDPIQNIEIEVLQEPYQIFRISARSLEEDAQKKTNSFWKDIFKGLAVNSENRNFVEEIKAYQRMRFYQARNLEFLFSGPRPTTSENQKTIDLLLRNLDKNKLTLLNLKRAINWQHIVIAKSFELTKNHVVRIVVYDSNFPQIDNEIYYDIEKKEFLGGGVTGHQTEIVGIYVVDENDRDHFENALLKHYANICSRKP